MFFRSPGHRRNIEGASREYRLRLDSPTAPAALRNRLIPDMAETEKTNIGNLPPAPDSPDSRHREYRIEVAVRFANPQRCAPTPRARIHQQVSLAPETEISSDSASRNLLRDLTSWRNVGGQGGNTDRNCMIFRMTEEQSVESGRSYRLDLRYPPIEGSVRLLAGDTPVARGGAAGWTFDEHGERIRIPQSAWPASKPPADAHFVAVAWQSLSPSIPSGRRDCKISLCE